MVAFAPGLLYYEAIDQFGLHAIHNTTITFGCVMNLKTKVYYATSFICIPVYRFIVYPLVSRHIPNLLKRMGIGVFLCLVSSLISLAVDSIGHFYSNASQCIFDDNTATGTIPIPIYWVLVIEVVNGIGIVVNSMFNV